MPSPESNTESNANNTIKSSPRKSVGGASTGSNSELNDIMKDKKKSNTPSGKGAPNKKVTSMQDHDGPMAGEDVINDVEEATDGSDLITSVDVDRVETGATGGGEGGGVSDGEDGKGKDNHNLGEGIDDNGGRGEDLQSNHPFPQKTDPKQNSSVDLTNMTASSNNNTESAKRNLFTTPPVSPSKATNSILLNQPGDLVLHREIDKRMVAKFQVKANALEMSLNEQIGIVIAAGWGFTTSTHGRTHYVNPYSQYVGYHWSDDNAEKEAALDLIIPSIADGYNRHDVMSLIIQAGLLKRDHQASDDDAKPPAEKKSKSRSKTAKAKSGSPPRKRMKGEGEESASPTTFVEGKAVKGDEEITDSKSGSEFMEEEEEGGIAEDNNQSANDSDESYVDTGYMGDDRIKPGSKYYPKSDDEESGEMSDDDSRRIKRDTDEATGFGVVSGYKKGKGNRSGYIQLTKKKQKNQTRVPLTDKQCAEEFGCGWDHVVYVASIFNVHCWENMSVFQFQKWWASVAHPTLKSGKTDKTGEVVEGLKWNEDMEEPCMNFMSKVNASRFVELKLLIANCMAANQDAEDSDDSSVVVLGPTEQLQPLNDDEYWELTKKHFLHYVSQSNNGRVGKKAEMVSIAAVNDFQRFASTNKDGTDKNETVLRNVACQLEAEYVYHHKDETTDPNHIIGLNYVTDFEDRMWNIRSKKSVADLRQQLSYRNVIPFGVDPYKKYNIHRICCGNPYFKMNYSPRGQADAPLILRNLMPVHSNLSPIYTQKTCTMSGLYDVRDGGICEDPNHKDGCGRTLTAGDLVLPWGEDIQLVRGEVYYIGVWTVETRTLGLVCRVGYVKSAPHQVRNFQNRLAVVSKIVPPDEKYVEEFRGYDYNLARLEMMRRVQEKKKAKAEKEAAEEGKKKRGGKGSKGAPATELTPTYEAVNDWINEQNSMIEKKRGVGKGKKRKTAVEDMPWCAAVDGYATLVFTDGNVEIKTQSATVQKK